MIKYNKKFNESVKSNSSFLLELKEKLPEFFTKDKYNDEGILIEEGGFDSNKFLEALKERNINEINSGNQLNFIGKDYAKKQTGEYPRTVIVPDKKHNQSPENKNSGNIFFTGDNLEVLQHMQSKYQNSVDLIYIDPPYNTGGDDFAYPDTFKHSDDDLQNMFGLDDEGLRKLKSIQGKATHSAWLTFIYPRISLAKKLLADTGIICVSIDDNEHANLKLLMDEIFGEKNFISSVYWKSRSSQQYSDKYISNVGEYILIFAKNLAQTNEFGKDKNSPPKTRNPDNDPQGEWTDSGIIRDDGRKKYTVTSPSGKTFHEAWLYSEENFNKFNNNNEIWWGENGDSKPRRKNYLKKWNGNPFTSLINEEITTDKGTNEVKELFNNKRVFNYPKPTMLILKKILKYANLNKSSIIMDFFAGSGTTADAVMQLNAEDGGNRKFIMVNSAEPLFTIDNNGGGGKFPQLEEKLHLKPVLRPLMKFHENEFNLQVKKFRRPLSQT